MKAGDLVRFWKPTEVFEYGAAGETTIGLLVEYHKWEKVATVMDNDGVIHRIRAEWCQKAGKKDQEVFDNHAKKKRSVV